MANSTVPVNFYSPVALEPWFWATPDITGIGGSETSHIQLSERLSKRGFSVRSFNKLPENLSDILPNPTSPAGVPWWSVEVGQTRLNEPNGGIWLIYRDTNALDAEKHVGNIWWFVAQDVGYNFTDEQLAKVDRYICLCKEHARWTLQKHPSLKGRIFISTNGIRRDLIEKVEKQYVLDEAYHKPHHLIYSSSPDRGLLFILRQWFRIRERVPDAELHVHYGFKNMELIEAILQGPASFSQDKDETQDLLKQDGIHFHGRQPQADLFRSFFRSSIWAYPTDWPETSCITCMEAQACGAIPVTNKFWAVGENVFAGVMLPGIPQKNPYIGALWVAETIKLLEKPELGDAIREEMMLDARSTFDWDRVIESQIAPWLEEDMKKL